MKINKKVKIAAGSLLGTFLLLFVVLVAHIATANPLAPDTATIQVSRIDFSKPLDAKTASEVKKNLRSLKGITSDSIIVKENRVVYFHDNRVTNSEKIFRELMAKGHYDAAPFLVPKSLASKPVCPAMDPDGYSYKFSLAVQKIFN